METPVKKYDKKYGKRVKIEVGGEVIAVQKISSRRIADGREFPTIQLTRLFKGEDGLVAVKFNGRLDLPLDVTAEQLEAIAEAIIAVKE